MKKRLIFAILIAIIAYEFHELMPKYPEGQENVTWKRKFMGASVKVFFRAMVTAERLGLIADSAHFIQNLFRGVSTQADIPEDIKIENSTLAGVNVLIFRPSSAENSSRAIIYYHGGGFVLCSPNTHFRWTLRLARATNTVVISVDYPLAPQHPYPAAIDASIKVAKAIFDSAKCLGLDRNRIAVAGDSAGGNLAAVVAVELAAVRDQYPLKAQILIVPTLVAAGVSSLPSYAHYSNLFMLNLDWFMVKYAGLQYSREIETAINSEHHVSKAELETIRHRLNISALSDDLLELIPDVKYANTRESGASDEEMKTRPPAIAAIGKLALDQRAWPLIFEDDSVLSHVAPALIQPCAFDPLRDEALLYFDRLRKLNVKVKLSFLPNAIHAEPLFRDITGVIPSKAAVKGLNDIVEFVNAML